MFLFFIFILFNTKAAVLSCTSNCEITIKGENNFVENISEEKGIILVQNSTLEILGATFTNNTVGLGSSQGSGALLHLTDSNFVFNYNRFKRNNFINQGGCIYIFSTEKTISLEIGKNSWESNTANQGSILFFNGLMNISLFDNEFFQNKALYGSTISFDQVEGQVNITNNSFVLNTASLGSSFSCEAGNSSTIISFSNSKVSNNVDNRKNYFSKKNLKTKITQNNKKLKQKEQLVLKTAIWK